MVRKTRQRIGIPNVGAVKARDWDYGTVETWITHLSNPTRRNFNNSFTLLLNSMWFTFSEKTKQNWKHMKNALI